MIGSVNALLRCESPAQPRPGALRYRGAKVYRVSRLNYTGSVAETGGFLGTTISTSSSATENSVTPKAVLSWQPDRDDLVYLNEVLYRPIEALTFDVTAAYTDARLTKTSCAGSQSYDEATSSCISSAAD